MNQRKKRREKIQQCTKQNKTHASGPSQDIDLYSSDLCNSIFNVFELTCTSLFYFFRFLSLLCVNEWNQTKNDNKTLPPNRCYKHLTTHTTTNKPAITVTLTSMRRSAEASVLLSYHHDRCRCYFCFCHWVAADVRSGLSALFATPNRKTIALGAM